MELLLVSLPTIVICPVRTREQNGHTHLHPKHPSKTPFPHTYYAAPVVHHRQHHQNAVSNLISRTKPRGLGRRNMVVILSTYRPTPRPLLLAPRHHRPVRAGHDVQWYGFEPLSAYPPSGAVAAGGVCSERTTLKTSQPLALF